MILSTDPAASNLLAAGYIRLGQLTGVEVLALCRSSPNDHFAFVDHSQWAEVRALEGVDDDDGGPGPVDAGIQQRLDAIGGAIRRSRTAVRQEAELRVLRSAYASLTAREREVMGLVVSGMLNKQIASDLGTSEITVKIQRGNVMRKMQVRSVAELARIGERLGL